MVSIKAAVVSVLLATSADAWCKPGTYKCLSNKTGWGVCTTASKWVVGGSCGKKNYCAMNWQNKSPYCIRKGTAPPWGY
ncbi:hypothetical protein QBC39DRAFT_366642 [Podospora conica]|nr:hypothetical protein QBC39DRAFT_366642 [Schizothecium conicum]